MNDFNSTKRCLNFVVVVVEYNNTYKGDNGSTIFSLVLSGPSLECCFATMQIREIHFIKINCEI